MLTHGARGPHRRRAVPAARASRDIPLVGSQLTLALVEAKLAEHRIKPVHAGGRRRADRAARAVRLRVLRGQPLDPRRARGGDQAPRPASCCTPATSRWTSCRSTAGSPTWPASPGSAPRASTCCCPTRPTPRSPASSRPSGRSARCSTTVFAKADRPDHRRVLRLARAPRAAGARRRGQAPAQGRLRRPVDGAQHGRRPRPRLPARARRPDGRPATTPRTLPPERGRAHLHRFAGRADVGAVAHGQPRPPQIRIGPGDTVVLASLARSPATRPRSTGSSTGCPGWGATVVHKENRDGARLRARAGRRAALPAQHRQAEQLHAGARRVAAPAGPRRLASRPACPPTGSCSPRTASSSTWSTGSVGIVGAVPCGYVYVDGSPSATSTESAEGPAHPRRRGLHLGDRGRRLGDRQGRRRPGDPRRGSRHRGRGVLVDVLPKWSRRSSEPRARASPTPPAPAARPAHRRQVGQRHLPPPPDDHPGRRRGLGQGLARRSVRRSPDLGHRGREGAGRRKGKRIGGAGGRWG